MNFIACKVILLILLPYTASGLVENNFKSLRKKKGKNDFKKLPYSIAKKNALHSIAWNLKNFSTTILLT